MRAGKAEGDGVNFYKRYPSDYAKKTSRLSLAQHGAYTLLLDEFYTTEQPLPADLGELYRLCRALSKPEQEAVRFVAEKFFPVGDHGLRHNNRAVEELIEATPALEAARANGKKGGRPPTRTQQKPSGFPEQNPEPNPTQTQRKPRTKPPQSSDISSSLRSEDTPSLSDLVAVGFDERTAGDFIAHKAKHRAPLTARAWRDHLAEAAKAGWTPLAAAEKVLAKHWKGFEAKYVANEAQTETNYAREMRETWQQAAPLIAVKKAGEVRKNPTEIIEGMVREQARISG